MTTKIKELKRKAIAKACNINIDDIHIQKGIDGERGYYYTKDCFFLVLNKQDAEYYWHKKFDSFIDKQIYKEIPVGACIGLDRFFDYEKCKREYKKKGRGYFIACDKEEKKVTVENKTFYVYITEYQINDF